MCSFADLCRPSNLVLATKMNSTEGCKQGKRTDIFLNTPHWNKTHKLIHRVSEDMQRSTAFCFGFFGFFFLLDITGNDRVGFGFVFKFYLRVSIFKEKIPILQLKLLTAVWQLITTLSRLKWRQGWCGAILRKINSKDLLQSGFEKKSTFEKLETCCLPLAAPPVQSML